MFHSSGIHLVADLLGIIPVAVVYYALGGSKNWNARVMWHLAFLIGAITSGLAIVRYGTFEDSKMVAYHLVWVMYGAVNVQRLCIEMSRCPHMDDHHDDEPPVGEEGKILAPVYSLDDYR